MNASQAAATPAAAPLADTAPEKATVSPLAATTSTAAPVADTKVEQGSSSSGLDSKSALGQLASKLATLLDRIGHHEVFGVELSPWADGSVLPVPQQIILQKFLRASAGDVTKATQQLEKTLEWRKAFQPLKARDEVFDKKRFEGLGYVVELTGVPSSKNDKDVAVFNIYGAVKDNKKTFGDLDGFIRWRVALHELTLAQLDLPNARTPLSDYGKGPDPYQAIQIHDYLSVSFLRQAPEVKAASSKTIQLFQDNYPETVSKKFFVNVPIFMQWMFGAMKLVMSAETVAKMKWMSYGNQLHQDLGSSVAKSYGGTGPELAEAGLTPKYEAADGPTKTIHEATNTQEPLTAATPAAGPAAPSRPVEASAGPDAGSTIAQGHEKPLTAPLETAAPEVQKTACTSVEAS